MMISTNIYANEKVEINNNIKVETNGVDVGESSGELYTPDNTRLGSGTTHQDIMRYDNNKKFSFHVGTIGMSAVDLYSKQAFTDVTDGNIAITLKSGYGDASVKFYQKRSNTISTIPSELQDTLVDAAILARAGQTTYIDISSFDPDEWYYVVLTGNYIVDGVSTLNRTR